MNKIILKDEILNNEEKNYFYVINYPTYHEDLCKMEMKYIFNVILQEKYLFSNLDVDISRSPFIKEGIKIIYRGTCLKEIIENIKLNRVSYRKFKMIFLKIDGDIGYKDRMKALSDVGFEVIGEASVHNPEIILAISKINGVWIFGEYRKNDYRWHIHDKKPYSYSNGLSMRVSRALVNIAVGNEMDTTIVDPCCGIGTVVIEALSLNLNIKGYEINSQIGRNAKKNLEFLKYRDTITIGDMHNIQQHFQVAIVDIPYGLFSPTTIEEQSDIVKTARRIADKMIIVTFEDMSDLIVSSGFKIIDGCSVLKGGFKRYISICK